MASAVRRTGDASLHETCDLELRLLVGTASSAAQLLSESDVRLSCCRGPVLRVIALLSAWLIWTCVSSIAAVMSLRQAVPHHSAAGQRWPAQQASCTVHADAKLTSVEG